MNVIETESKIVFITGITGQDGSYLAEYLLKDPKYIVFGMRRPSSSSNTKRIQHLLSNPRLYLEYGDMTSSDSFNTIFEKIKKLYGQLDYVYNLAAQSHVAVSFESRVYTSEVVYLGFIRLICSLDNMGWSKHTRVYQASSSEMFGKVADDEPLNESSSMDTTQSPYANDKLACHRAVRLQRELGCFMVSGILFNHTSPRRGDNFVLKKITNGIRDIMTGKLDCLTLGNLNSKRDLTHSKDMVRAMKLMLENTEPVDYVVSSDNTYGIRQLIELTFDMYNIKVEFIGEGVNEICKRKDNGDVVVRVSEEFFRPAEVAFLLGDSSKIRRELGWQPTYDIKAIIKDMIENEN